MKRPRRPAKRVASKKAKVTKRKKSKIVTGLKQALKHARSEPPLPWTEEDAAVFDIPKPPAGFAYQWAPFSRIVYMLSRGWSQVPYSRHTGVMPLATNFDGYIVYRDTALFQISEELVKAETRRLSEIAQETTGEFDEMLGAAPGARGRGFVYILPSSFIASSDYESYPDASGPVDVQLTITLRVPARWCDMANALNIGHGEYARRRITMSGHLIAPDEVSGVFSPFELTTKKVEI